MLELGYPTNSADSKLQMSWQIKFCHDPFITLTDVFLRPDHSFEGWGYFHTAASETVNPHPSAVFPSHALVSPSENLACPVKISLCTRTNNLNCIQKKKTKNPQSLFLGGEADIFKLASIPGPHMYWKRSENQAFTTTVKTLGWSDRSKARYAHFYKKP